ncbi:hypothetical protein ACFWRG_19990 [Micromonospora tulbaghiae]|uniref:hypothetical protein n=1 Tax=Micromonospora tulbaghiae TaxID=479978 RepID=UPI0033B1959E
MLDLLTPLLADTTGPAAWIVFGVVITFLFFVGLTLFVALFSQDKTRADRAHRILRELLAMFTFRRRR